MLVETGDGERLLAHGRKRLKPLCGDWVQIEQRGDDAQIAAIEARQSVFQRADLSGQAQPVAANLNLVLIVVAPQPPPTRDLVPRYQVALAALKLPGMLICNKADTIAAEDPDWQQFIRDCRDGELSQLQVSAHSGEGLDALRECLRAHSTILVGMSGVGKSSLLNSLVPDASASTGGLSTAHGKGRHTTSTTTLYRLSGGGELIDSPGVWEYGLWALPPRTVQDGYPDIVQHACGCRFADCLHQGEPGCAVNAAIANQTLRPERLESYHRVLRTLPRATGYGGR